MTAVVNGRWTAQPEAGFVVFIIGMRINNWWMIHRWLPLVLMMGRMIRELSLQPELGFLGGKSWFGRTFVLIQYWHSLEQLEAYARAKDRQHLPAWAYFNRKIASDGAVGIYHETYRIQPGEYEHVFVNMLRTLLGDCSSLVEVKGKLSKAAERLGRLPHDENKETFCNGRATANEQIVVGSSADRVGPTAARDLNPVNQTRHKGDSEMDDLGNQRQPSLERKNVEDLRATVDKALTIADAAGFDLIGIDLCSALERLKKMDKPPQPGGHRPS